MSVSMQNEVPSRVVGCSHSATVPIVFSTPSSTHVQIQLCATEHTAPSPPRQALSCTPGTLQMQHNESTPSP